MYIIIYIIAPSTGLSIYGPDTLPDIMPMDMQIEMHKQIKQQHDNRFISSNLNNLSPNPSNRDDLFDFLSQSKVISY